MFISLIFLFSDIYNLHEQLAYHLVSAVTLLYLKHQVGIITQSIL